MTKYADESGDLREIPTAKKRSKKTKKKKHPCVVVEEKINCYKKKPKRKSVEAPRAVAARLQLMAPSEYTDEGWKAIQKWLNGVVDDVSKWRKEGQLDSEFTARYYYTPGE